MSGANSTVAKYCAELKMAAAVPRSAVGNQAERDAAVAGEGRRLGRADQQAQREQRGHGRAAGQEADRALSRVNSDHRKMLKK